MNPIFAWRNVLAYGLLGLPLAFAALPLYVILPNHYAREFGVPLAALGAVLLGARLADALVDPLLGRWSDKLLARSPKAVLGVAALAAVLLATGLVLLFSPDRFLSAPDAQALLIWAAAMLLVTYLGYSLLSILHQAWGALLGGTQAERSRITGGREALGLVGVLTASVLPSLLGLPLALAVFVALLALGWLAWRRSLAPDVPPSQTDKLPRFSKALGCVHAQRRGQCGAGHAGAFFRARQTASPAGHGAAVFGQLFFVRSPVHPAVAGTGQALGLGAQLVDRHAAGGGRVCVGQPFGGG